MSKLSIHETEQENENAGSPTLQHLAAEQLCVQLDERFPDRVEQEGQHTHSLRCVTKCAPMY
jgi:hypothetical protein